MISQFPQELPSGASLLAVGEPIENCGFTGFEFENGDNEHRWKVVVKNYGKQPQSRDWWVEREGKRSAVRHLSLESGELRSLSGSFPHMQDALQVVLSEDGFPLDNRLPLVQSKPKELTLYVEPQNTYQHLAHRFLMTYQGLRLGWGFSGISLKLPRWGISHLARKRQAQDSKFQTSQEVGSASQVSSLSIENSHGTSDNTEKDQRREEGKEIDNTSRRDRFQRAKRKGL